MDEQEIIIGIKKGNPAAYRQLFLKYYPTIYRFLLRLTHDEETAKDIAQEIFMKIWINRSCLDPKLSVKNLIFVMAKNAAFNYLKSKGRLAVNIEDKDFADNKTCEANLEYSELKSSLDQRIDAMPEQRKRIFTMSRYQQMSNKEIADKLGLSVRTIEKHLELALRDIKDIYPS